MPGRNPFTRKEDELLVQYIAENHPQTQGRLGNDLYQKLVGNPEKYPWSKTHPFSSWRERYKTNKDEFDRKIRNYLKTRNHERSHEPPQRSAFTDDEDKLLYKFISVYNPQPKGRNGNALYKMLVENARKKAGGKWNWSRTHSWQAWRSRYVSRAEEFDELIAEYQARRRTKGSESSTRAVSKEEGASDSIRPTKRRRLTTEESKQEDEKVEAVQPSHSPKKATSRTHPNKSEENVGDKDSDSDGDPSPPGSDDYHGQVFSESGESEHPGRKDSLGPSDENQDENQVEQDLSSETPPGPDFCPPEVTNKSNQSPRSHSEHEREVKEPHISDSAERKNSSNKLQLRKIIKNDVFEDYEPPPLEHHPTATKPRKGPAVLAETSFRTTFKQSRAVATPDISTGDGDEEVHSPPPLPRAFMNGENASHPEEKNNEPPTKPTTMDEPALETQITDAASEVRQRHNIFPIDRSTDENKSSAESTSTGRSRHIDLRQEFANKKPTRKSSRQSQLPTFDEEEDQRFLQEIAVRHFSDEFGFTEVFVRRLWEGLGSVRLVQKALTDMRNEAEQSMRSWIHKSRSLDRVMVTPDVPVSIRQATSKSRSPAKSRKSLGIIPITDRSMDLDYDPPSGSRAGKYARLAKMGRENEARERERRRVSNAAISPKGRFSPQAIKNLSEAAQLRGNSDMLDDKDEDVFLDRIRPSQIKPDAPAEPADKEPKAEGEEAVLRPDSMEKAEVENLIRSDADRWKEVEHLFLSANRQNREMLKGIERTFEPEFLLEWLCSKSALKL